jgi:hypothetical protein
MTDLDIIKECRQTGRTRTTTEYLLEKAYYEQMTEKEQLKAQIQELQEQLQKLEELDRVKSPAEEAFKRVYCRYPDKYDSSWDIFEKGYTSAKEDCEVGEYEPTPQGPQGPVGPGPGPKGVIVGYEPTPQERGDRIHWEVEKLQEKNWYVDAKDLIESETTPPEPTSTVFRQKLFDGIKSVFYDPDYERTHWKMKVDMAVDEVLTHFYDILPEPQEPVCDEFVEGWNCCLAEIEACMEFSDDGN